ncbi:MAG: hypothetical protein ABFR36_03345 [Acidobacteriota bacterium]
MNISGKTDLRAVFWASVGKQNNDEPLPLIDTLSNPKLSIFIFILSNSGNSLKVVNSNSFFNVEISPEPKKVFILLFKGDFVKLNREKISLVEICKPGIKTAILSTSGVFDVVSISPTPSPSIVPPVKKNGTSAPISTPNEINSANVISRSKKSLMNIITTAAFELPPPSPDPAGIRFFILISNPSLRLNFLYIRLKALFIVFDSSQEIFFLSPVRLILFSRFSFISIRSQREIVWKMVLSSWYPFSLFPVTSSPRLIFAKDRNSILFRI